MKTTKKKAAKKSTSKKLPTTKSSANRSPAKALLRKLGGALIPFLPFARRDDTHEDCTYVEVLGQDGRLYTFWGDEIEKRRVDETMWTSMLASGRGGRLIVAKVDTEARPDVSAHFHIQSIPTMSAVSCRVSQPC